MRRLLLLSLLLPLALLSCSESGMRRQYFFLNAGYKQYNYELLSEHFGPQEGLNPAIGNAILIYIFAQPVEETKAALEKHFQLAQQFDIPVLVELDPVTFWNDVPEIWNWWDPSAPGYNPANRENVEWYGWGADKAVRIGWLNWGRQIRLAPMANLFSPAYQAAVKERMDALLSCTTDWYKSLPREKKWLLGGVKITGEFCLGINNWYYPDGNSIALNDPSDDPQTGIDVNVLPGRNVAPIGYAALTYMGRKSEGELTADDVYAIEKEYGRFVADISQGYGFPRYMLFSHAGGADGDLQAAVYPNTCPSFSFYWEEAMAPHTKEGIDNILASSDAPCWACAEWNIGYQAREKWDEVLERIYSDTRCRFVTLFNYNTIFRSDENGAPAPDTAVIEALKAAQKHI